MIKFDPHLEGVVETSTLLAKQAYQDFLSTAILKHLGSSVNCKKGAMNVGVNGSRDAVVYTCSICTATVLTISVPDRSSYSISDQK